jgi:hypothetical protein
VGGSLFLGRATLPDKTIGAPIFLNKSAYNGGSTSSFGRALHHTRVTSRGPTSRRKSSLGILTGLVYFQTRCPFLGPFCQVRAEHLGSECSTAIVGPRYPPIILPLPANKAQFLSFFGSMDLLKTPFPGNDGCGSLLYYHSPTPKSLTVQGESIEALKHVYLATYKYISGRGGW